MRSVKPGDLVRVIEKNRVHGGKVGVVLRVYPDKRTFDVLIDGKVRVGAGVHHFEVISAA